MRITAEEVEALLRPVCRRDRIQLCEVSVSGKPSLPYIKVVVDYEETNITIDDCVRITKELQDLLDMGPHPIPNYRLEVSSPGIGFPLTEVWQFKKNAGKWIVPPKGAVSKEPVLLVGVKEDGELMIRGSEGVRSVSLEQWKGARVTLANSVSHKMMSNQRKVRNR
ncbi:MAG: ribosome maturation factor RimP [bacterium]